MGLALGFFHGFAPHLLASGLSCRRPLRPAPKCSPDCPADVVALQEVRLSAVCCRPAQRCLYTTLQPNTRVRLLLLATWQVWVLADVERLRQAGAEGGALPHSFHYQSGALGSGLLLLSRFPIAEVGAARGQQGLHCGRMRAEQLCAAGMLLQCG